MPLPHSSKGFKLAVTHIYISQLPSLDNVLVLYRFHSVFLNSFRTLLFYFVLVFLVSLKVHEVGDAV